MARIQSRDVGPDKVTTLMPVKSVSDNETNKDAELDASICEIGKGEEMMKVIVDDQTKENNCCGFKRVAYVETSLDDLDYSNSASSLNSSRSSSPIKTTTNNEPGIYQCKFPISLLS